MLLLVRIYRGKRIETDVKVNGHTNKVCKSPLNCENRHVTVECELAVVRCASCKECGHLAGNIVWPDYKQVSARSFKATVSVRRKTFAEVDVATPSSVVQANYLVSMDKANLAGPSTLSHRVFVLWPKGLTIYIPVVNVDVVPLQKEISIAHKKFV